MTVSSQVSSVSYAGDGVTTLLPVPFYFLEQEHLLVTRVSPSGSTNVLALGSDYSVSGAGNQSGGSITIFIPASSGFSTIIDRSVPATQETDYVANDPFPAESHERALDKLTMLVQQNASGLARALLRPIGKNYYDAEGRQIKNLADPTQDQDAATRLWVSQFVGGLIGAIQGPINNAANIFYQAPDGSANVVQDMSDPDGAVLIGGAGVIVPSVYDLTQLANPKDGRSYSTQGYRPGSTKGGGHFIWRAAASKALHDGVAFIDPGRPYPSDFNNTGQVSSWLTPSAGTGVFVKVWSPVRGAYEAGISDTASASDRQMLTALLNSLAAQGGRLAIMPFQLSTVFPFTVEVPRTISLDLNDSTIDFQITGGIRAFSMNSRCQLYNGAVFVNGTSPVGGGDNHAPVAGGNQTTGAGINKTRIFDLTLTTNRSNGNGICFFGECTGIEIDNITFPSSATLGRAVALEWGGDTTGTGHPHNCKISNIFCGTMSANVNGFMIWLSSAFNIKVTNVYADSVYGLCGVFTGDRSNDYAPLRYRDLVGTGIVLENVTCRSVKQYGIRCYGKGGLSSNLLPQSATIINPILRSDGLTVDAVGIVCEFTENVTIINPDISYMQIGISTGQETRNLLVKGGKVWGNRASGISIGSAGGGVARCTVEDVRLYGNNSAGFSGVGGAAAIFIQNCTTWAVKNCHFGIAGGAETQQYSVRIESTAPDGLLKGNRTLGLVAGGVAYVNSSSTDYAVNTIGEDNAAAAGLTVFGGAPVYFIKGNGLKYFIIAGAAAPASGTWARGDTCEFALPSAGGNKGAVCVAPGTPGTWKTFGGIAA